MADPRREIPCEWVAVKVGEGWNGFYYANRKDIIFESTPQKSGGKVSFRTRNEASKVLEKHPGLFPGGVTLDHLEEALQQAKAARGAWLAGKTATTPAKKNGTAPGGGDGNAAAVVNNKRGRSSAAGGGGGGALALTTPATKRTKKPASGSTAEDDENDDGDEAAAGTLAVLGNGVAGGGNNSHASTAAAAAALRAEALAVMREPLRRRGVVGADAAAFVSEVGPGMARVFAAAWFAPVVAAEITFA